MPSKTCFRAGLCIEEVPEGLLVRQVSEAYVAKSWRLTSSVISLLKKATKCDLGCMIRQDHPRGNARSHNTRGAVYQAFSPYPTLQWALAIDSLQG